MSTSERETPSRLKLTFQVTYHEIARRILLKQSEADICQQMGLSLPTLQGITRRKEFLDVFEPLRAKAFEAVDAQIEHQGRDLRDEIKLACEESFDRLMMLLRISNNDAIMKDIAQDMLDRGGYGAKVEAQAPTIVVNALDASVLMDALNKAREGKALLANKDVLALARPSQEHADAIKQSRQPGD
jgi:hypothetical protein